TVCILGRKNTQPSLCGLVSLASSTELLELVNGRRIHIYTGDIIHRDAVQLILSRLGHPFATYSTFDALAQQACSNGDDRDVAIVGPELTNCDYSVLAPLCSGAIDGCQVRRWILLEDPLRPAPLHTNLPDLPNLSTIRLPVRARMLLSLVDDWTGQSLAV
ncbi:MAG: hypothetical protein AAGC55_03215, partial [Myxococcota bacterium]